MRQRPGHTRSANLVRPSDLPSPLIPLRSDPPSLGASARQGGELKRTRYSKVAPSGRTLGSWPKASRRWKRKVWASLFSSPLSLAAKVAKSRKERSIEVMPRAAVKLRRKHAKDGRKEQGTFDAGRRGIR